MSYSKPPRYTHGDHVLAADLNIIGDDIVYLYARSGGVDTNFGVLNISDNLHRQKYFVIHRFRWLWYRGSGYMELFSGADLHRTSLDSPTAWATALDLDSLGWLHYHNFYIISGVSWALETQDA